VKWPGRRKDDQVADLRAAVVPLGAWAAHHERAVGHCAATAANDQGGGVLDEQDRTATKETIGKGRDDNMNAIATARPNGRTVSNKRLSRLGLLHEPAGYVDGPSLYQYVGSTPTTATDPLGLRRVVHHRVFLIEKVVSAKVLDKSTVEFTVPRVFHVTVMAVLAIALSSCAHAGRSPDADDYIEVNTAEDSAFVIRSAHASPIVYELRRSVKLAVTPYGELTADGNDFAPPVVLPVEGNIRCQLNAHGELHIAKSDDEWVAVGRLPVFRVADSGGMSSLSQSDYDRLVSSGEYGRVRPITFVLILDSGVSLTMRAATCRSR
jgi:hypothetical protein